MVRLILAWVHLLALAIGLSAVWSRARSLEASRENAADTTAIDRALTADAWWGVAALLWFVSGVWRLVGSTEKNMSWYLGNHVFLAKMGLFLVVFALEIWPMITLMRWRRNDRQPTVQDARRIENISYIQCLIIIVMVFAAVTMARGYGHAG